MQSKSLKQAMEEAEIAAPQRTNAAWEAGKGVELEIVSSNASIRSGKPRIGLQIQREDGRRKWFDLYFDEENAMSYKMSGIKLKALGCGDLINQLDEQYPVNDNDPIDVQEANVLAQFETIASALKGVRFVGEIDKKVNRRTENLPEDQQEFVNFFQVSSLIDGPVVSTFGASSPTTGFSGFGGGVNLMGE